MPGRATSKWWKEERIGVFVDYNQNARDRTVASAYSRPRRRRRARLLPARVGRGGRRRAGRAAARHGARAAARARRPSASDRRAPRLARQPARARARATRPPGLGDAPWPPNFPKQRARAARGALTRQAAPEGRPHRQRGVAGRPRTRSSRVGPPAATPGGSRSAQLVEQALARRLVLAPAEDLRAVADPPVARVVVADLDDQLGPQRDPLELALGLPAARLAAAALAGLVGGQLARERALRAAAKAELCPTGRSPPSGRRARGSASRRCPARRPGGSRSRRSRSCAARLTLTIAVRLPGRVGGVEALGDDALGLRSQARPRPGR